MRMVFPDYTHSILNLASSILKAYGCECRHPSLPVLDQALAPRERSLLATVPQLLGRRFEQLHQAHRSALSTPDDPARWLQPGAWLHTFCQDMRLVLLAELDLRDAFTEIDRLKTRLEAETAYLQDEIRLEHNFEGIIGRSPAMQAVFAKHRQAFVEAMALDKDKQRLAEAKQPALHRVASRSVTQRAEHDPEVLARTRALDALQHTERRAQQAVEAQEQAALDARQSAAAARQRLSDLESSGYARMNAERRKVELRVFLYRLALTLPLLALAGWLFVKQRRSTYWPFVWGFIWFALFAFFVELVPYLPSYGGYVRYIVGIVLTVVGGRYAIQALQRYLERQKQVEALPDNQRRQGMDYDLAQARLVKNVCPGCERPVDLKDGKTDFCPHCGLCLFDHCGSCNTRKSAFARYCFACGTPAKGESASREAPTPV